MAVGNVDAHVSAAAAQAVEPGQLVAIMGTSTCHVMSGAVLRDVPGMCGVVDGGIIPGLWGYEAGQSGVGDIFGWFVNGGRPAGVPRRRGAGRGLSVHEHLTELAASQPIGAHGLVALDWHSGNRSILVDHELSGLVVGQTLATRPEDTYRALLESTAFGARVIVEAFAGCGRAGHRVHRRGRAAAQPAADADLRRRARPAPVGGDGRSRVRPSGRRSTRRSPPGPTPTSARPRRRDGWPHGRCLPVPVPANVAAYDELYRRVPARCTTTSAAAATTSCAGSRRSAAGPSHERPHERRRARGRRRAAGGRRRPARRAHPQRPRRLDRGQRLGAGAGRGPVRDQAVRESPTTS